MWFLKGMGHLTPGCWVCPKFRAAESRYPVTIYWQFKSVSAPWVQAILGGPVRSILFYTTIVSFSLRGLVFLYGMYLPSFGQVVDSR